MPIVPPIALRRSKKFSAFGERREDPYFWMRDIRNPETLKYLRRENAFATNIMRSTRKQQKQIYQEMKGRIQETDSTVPAVKGEYEYYSRMVKGKPYRIHCRKRRRPRAKEEILLDGNRLAQGKKFFSLGAFEISPDQNFLAYSVDFSGAEAFTIYFKDLRSGKVLRENVVNVSYGIEWGSNGQNIYYLTRDRAQRPYRVYRHDLGSAVRRDVLLFEEKDEAFHLWLQKTSDEKFVLIGSENADTSEIHLIDANGPKAKPLIFARRKQKIEYSIDHSGKYFYIRTNEGSKNFKVLRTRDRDLQPKFWKEIIPHRREITITGIFCFKDWLIVEKREKGLKKFQVVSLKSSSRHDIEFPEATYDLWEGTNLEFETQSFRLGYSSLVTPVSVFDYDLKARKLILKKTERVLGAYNPKNYRTQRLWAKAGDGTKIPISVVSRRGFKKNGEGPLLLDGYGAYGISHDAHFSSSRLSLLDRGFAFAIAHIRGGGEMGEEWHDGGKLLKKKNTFTDFISAAEFLIQKKYTSKERLVISGRSAGGLLMGAVLNLRPDLFKAAIVGVPFVDTLNTMSDPSLPLTVTEYDEWGNPSKKRDYYYIRSYSPYDNLEAKAYPNILALTSLNDTRVAYWEAAKWIAKLRTVKTDGNLVLLKTLMDAGHAGSQDRYKHLRELAFEYAFILKVLGLT